MLLCTLSAIDWFDFLKHSAPTNPILYHDGSVELFSMSCTKPTLTHYTPKTVSCQQAIMQCWPNWSIWDLFITLKIFIVPRKWILLGLHSLFFHLPIKFLSPTNKWTTKSIHVPQTHTRQYTCTLKWYTCTTWYDMKKNILYWCKKDVFQLTFVPSWVLKYFLKRSLKQNDFCLSFGFHLIYLSSR